jgi:hypothetical protein
VRNRRTRDRPYSGVPTAARYGTRRFRFAKARGCREVSDSAALTGRFHDHFNPAIAGAARSRAVVGDRAVLAEADRTQAIAIDTLLDQRVAHGLGTAL